MANFKKCWDFFARFSFGWFHPDTWMDVFENRKFSLSIQKDGDLFQTTIFLYSFFSVDSIRSVKEEAKLFKISFIKEAVIFISLQQSDWLYSLPWILIKETLFLQSPAMSGIPFGIVALYAFCVSLPEE